jgi:hypothetical protein
MMLPGSECKRARVEIFCAFDLIQFYFNIK